MRTGVHVPLGLILFLMLVVFTFGAVMIGLTRFLGKRYPDRSKLETYECGIPVQEKPDSRVSVKFYLVAILFIVFDIEIVFLYPWVVSFRSWLLEGFGFEAFLIMMVFMGLFLAGLWWEIRSKALEWD